MQLSYMAMAVKNILRVSDYPPYFYSSYLLLNDDGEVIL